MPEIEAILLDDHFEDQNLQTEVQKKSIPRKKPRGFYQFIFDALTSLSFMFQKFQCLHGRHFF